MKTSLKTRFTLVVLITGLGVLVTVALIAYAALYRGFEQVIIQKQEVETRRIADQIRLSMAYRLNALVATSSAMVQDGKLLTVDRLHNQLKRQVALTNLFPAGLSILDDHVTVIAESVYVAGRIGTNYADREHYKRLIRNRGPVLSQPLIGRKTGLPLLSLAAPIIDDSGELLGILSGIINLAETPLLEAGDIEYFGKDVIRFEVLDLTHGLFVNELTKGSGIKPFPPAGSDPLIDAVTEGKKSGELSDVNGHELLFAATPLEELGWLVVRAVPHDHAVAPALTLFHQFLIWSLMALVVGLALGYVAIRKAIAPLRDLAEHIARMSEKNAEVEKLDESGAREISSLASAFNRLAEQRAEVDMLKDQFVSNISHELRTPLTAIYGSLRLVNSKIGDGVSDGLQQMLQIAERNVARLQLLINDLLDLNKLIAGQVKVSPRALTWREIIDESIETIKSSAIQKDVEMRCEIPQDAQVLADPLRLRQVVDNYLSNALKFSPPETVISIQVLVCDNGRTRLTVSDQGEGVPEEFRARVFQRFSQADAGSDRSNQGTGLGLAIVKELALLMNGSVGYYNREGAHFWIELPCP